MSATKYSVLLLFACVAIVCASAGVLAQPTDAADDAAGNVANTTDNHYIAVTLQQTLRTVASGDPVVVYFRSPT